MITPALRRLGRGVCMSCLQDLSVKQLVAVVMMMLMTALMRRMSLAFAEAVPCEAVPQHNNPRLKC